MYTIKRIISGSLRARLLAILLLFSLLGLTVLSLVLYGVSSKILIRQEQAHNRLELDQLASNLQAFTRQMDVISKDFDASELVQSVLVRPSANRQADIDELRAVDHYIGKTVVTYSDWLSSINLIDAKGNVYYEGLGGTAINPVSYRSLLSSDFYRRMKAGKGKMVVGPLDLDGRHVMIGRVVNRVSDFQPVGLLVMHVRTEAITAYFSASAGSGASRYVLFNPYGDAIRSDNQKTADRHLLDIRDGDELTEGGIKFLVSREFIPSADWTLVKLTSIDSIIGGTIALQQALLVFGLIGTVVIILLSIVLSAKITRPLNNLTGLMRKSIEDRFLIRAPAERLDEVGELSRSYNLMMKEINDLINKEYKLNYLNKEMELRSLQAQINPHFIYNTLDSINWAARTHGLHDVGRMAESLANLLRISIRDQDIPYRIREELAYITNYMAIQQFRFEDRVRLELDVAPELHHVPIPKLIIQPLLENAIVHNVDTADEPIVIAIAMRPDSANEFVLVTVADNGGGVPSEVSLAIHHPMQERELGFPRGLANVHRRLVLKYGPVSGLCIDSSEKGTTIHFKIPIEKEAAQHDLQTAHM